MCIHRRMRIARKQRNIVVAPSTKHRN
jgi:hypothetical protein